MSQVRDFLSSRKIKTRRASAAISPVATKCFQTGEIRRRPHRQEYNQRATENVDAVACSTYRMNERCPRSILTPSMIRGQPSKVMANFALSGIGGSSLL